MSTTVANPTPSVPSEISVSDLGAMLGGETIATPTPETKPAEAQPKTAPAKAPAKPDAPEAATVETPVTEPEKKTEAEEQTAETNQEPKEKEKSWVDKRLSAQARRRREAEALALVEKQRADDLQRKLDELKANPGPQETKPEAKAAAPADKSKPVLQDFINNLKEGEPYETAVELYQDARDAWRDQQREAADKQKSQAEAQKTQQEAFREDWEAALESHPDFDDVVDRVRSVAPEGLQVAISQVQDAEGKSQWPDVTLYLDEHPDELSALVKQHKRNSDAALVSLGRIAAKLSQAPTPAPAKTTTTRKALPAPPTVLGTNAAPAPIDLEKADMDTFAREVVKYL